MKQYDVNIHMILFDSYPVDQRDYGILMFHQGNYQEALLVTQLLN